MKEWREERPGDFGDLRMDWGARVQKFETANYESFIMFTFTFYRQRWSRYTHILGAVCSEGRRALGTLGTCRGFRGEGLRVLNGEFFVKKGASSILTLERCKLGHVTPTFWVL